MSDSILVPIHKEHVSNIISGDKVFEFRKRLPKNRISFLVLYCTAPVQRIVAVVEVETQFSGSLEYVWNETCPGAGISYNDYMEYYKGYTTACVFKLGRVHILKTTLSLSDLATQKTAPQSFCYLAEEDMEIIDEKLGII